MPVGSCNVEEETASLQITLFILHTGKGSMINSLGALTVSSFLPIQITPEGGAHLSHIALRSLRTLFYSHSLISTCLHLFGVKLCESN